MIDRFIVDATQAAYDRIFDRTGVLKGQIVQLFIVIYVAVRLITELKGFLWPSIPMIFCFVLCAVNNKLQKERRYKDLNQLAEGYRESLYCFFWRSVVIWASLMMFLPNTKLYEFLYALVFLLFAYLMCVKVRDREPPESSFFNFNPTGA